jgi:pyrroline-5-carboxylate reductase
MEITVIGCGVIGGTIAKHFAAHHSLTLYDKHQDHAKQLADELQASFTQDPQTAVEKAELIVLAVKPQHLDEVSSLFKQAIRKGQTLVSVLMGTSLDALRKHFPHPTLIRLMPNTPMLYHKGVLAFVETSSTSPEQKQLIDSLFSGLGAIYWVPEDKIDAITALASSSPAYIFTLIEAMIDAAVYMGISASDGKNLVLQALEGSIEIAKASGKSPSQLKWDVASPAGSTISGILELERQGMRGAMMQTILAGYNRIKNR